jgi:hypothetical protein
MDSEEILLNEIVQILTKMEKATYGYDRANGNHIPPNVSQFRLCTKRLFEIVSTIVENYPHDYIDDRDLLLLYDSERLDLYNLELLNSKKNYGGYDLSDELEKYLFKMQSLFGKFVQRYKTLNKS